MLVGAPSTSGGTSGAVVHYDSKHGQAFSQL